MSKDNIFTRIIRRWKAGKQAEPQKPGAQLDSIPVAKLLQMVESTEEVELSCDEVFALLDQYAELQARGADAASLLPLVTKHLERCGDCREEYEALLRILGASPQNS